jgi:hypothetical protein
MLEVDFRDELFKAENRRQRSENRGQRSEIRSQWSVVIRQDVREQTSRSVVG